MGLAEDDYDFFQKGCHSNLSSNQEEINTVDSAQTYFPLFPLGFFIVLVTALGITGNVISSYVLTRKKLRSSSYSVLTLGLTLVDTAYLIIKLVRYGLLSIFSHFGIFYEYTNVLLPMYGPYLRPLTFTAHTASTYMTILIAFDRYLVIARPHTARRLCTTKKARILAMVMILFSILYNIPRWFEYHTVTCSSDEDDGELRYEMVISDLRANNKYYRKYYIFWAYIILMFFFPVVTLTIINYLVWKGLKQIKKSGLALSSTQSRDTSFSTMLVGVVIVFLICNLDYLVLDLLDYTGIRYPTIWSDVGNFLLTVNSAVNFLIYCLCGHKFRDELSSMMEKSGCFDCSKTLGTQSQDIFTTTGVWIRDVPRRDKNLARVTCNNE